MSRTALKLLLGLIVIFCAVRLAGSEPPNSGEISAQGSRLTRFHQTSSLATVFVVHSVYQDHFTCLPMARSLWNSGFEVVVVEFKGGLRFEDYVSELQDLVLRERGPVYGVGHSMGSDIVFSAQGFDGRAALGFPVDTSQVEGIVLVGAGAWDQVHTRASLEQAAGGAPLVISPFSDHSQESLDPYLQRAVCQAFGGRPDPVWPNRVLLQGSLVLAGSLLLIWHLPAGPSKSRLLTVATALALVMSNFWWPHPLLATLVVTLWFACAWTQSGSTPPGTGRLLLLNLMIISGVAGASWALHGYQNLWADPSNLLGLPVAVFSWYPILASRLTNGLCQTAGGWPVVLIALLFLEVVFPGRLFAFGRNWSGRFYQQLMTFDFRPELGTGKTQILILSVLLIICGLSWAKTLAAGYVLDANDLARLLWKLSSLLLLPFLLWLLMIRRLHARGIP